MGVSERAGHPYNFGLTERGEEEFRKMESEKLSEVKSIVEKYGDMPIFVLLDYIHDNYS